MFELVCIAFAFFSNKIIISFKQKSFFAFQESDKDMQSLRFSLRLNTLELLQYYQGQKKLVRVMTYSGRSLQFKADHLRPFVTKSGINGEFEIYFDEQNNFLKLTQIKQY